MTDLKKWNPFKFNRNQQSQQMQRKQTSSDVAKQERTYDPFRSMEQRMNTMMRQMFGDNDWFASGLRSAPSWFGDFRPTRFNPYVDVTEDNKNLVISAELPGLDKKDVNITVDEGVLSISGEKRQSTEKDEKGCYRTERYYGAFQRQIPLPEDIDSQHAEAAFDRGVLTVKFPKVDSKTSEPRHIKLT